MALNLAEVLDNPYVDKFQRRLQFGHKQRGRALKKLSTYVDNDVSLLEGLEQMARYATRDGKKPNSYSAKVYYRWHTKVSGGASLPDALKGEMPEAEHAMIEAAYRFGNLGQGIRSAIELRTHVAAIKRAIRGAILYPIALIGGLTLFFWYMSTTVFPGYHEALPMDRWPSSASSLAATSDFVNDHMLALYSAVAVVVAIISYTMPRWTGPARAWFDDHLPPWTINRIVYGTVFLLGLSGYLNASMNPTEVLGYTIKDANPWYAEKVRAILRHVQNGKNLGDAMSLSPYKFPSYELIEDLRVYAQYKDIAIVLDEQAKEILEDSINRIKSQAVVVRNVAILMIGSLMFWFTNSIFDFQGAVAAMAQSPN